MSTTSCITGNNSNNNNSNSNNNFLKSRKTPNSTSANADEHTYVTSNSINDKSDCVSTSSVDSANIYAELKKRQRDVLTYSILMLVFFTPIAAPLTPVAIYYGIKAGHNIDRMNRFTVCNSLLLVAHYLNLASFIVATLLFHSYVIISAIMLSYPR